MGNSKIIYCGVAGIVVGILVTLFIPHIRYTALVEPTIADARPSIVEEKLKANPDKYILIDVRSPAEYKKIHIGGAINIPIHMLYDERHNLPRSGKDIILYCTGGRLSGVAYSYLEHYGFANIERIEGGIEEWQSEGLPVVMEDLFSQ